MKEFNLKNKYISRKWNFCDNKLYTVSIKDELRNIEYITKPIKNNDFSYEGLTHETFPGYRNNPYKFEIDKAVQEKFSNNMYSEGGEKLIISLVDEYHGLNIDYIAILYNDSKAIKTYLEIDAFNMPEWYFFEKRYNVIDTYPINLSNYKINSFEFFTRTDYTNYLIEKKDNAIGFDKGNIIFAENNKKGIFFLKESPVYSDCRPESYGQFFIGDDFVSTLGTGIMPHEFKQQKMKTYGSVIGLYENSYDNRYIALKDYQKKASHYYPMILVNPWGDRKWMEHINEQFVIGEIKATAKLGGEYYQLDDGWYEGFGLIHIGYSKKMDKEFWNIKEDIFPNKFNKIVQVAKENNVRLALWIGLDCNSMYRNYLEQADIIYNMYKTYNIKVFKIDIMKLRSYESEENIEKLFKLLREKSDGEIIFNLDVTADRRSGYFMFNEYGVIFLENRYEKKDNYKPYLTLKNQWDLANFVPLQNLQIEFLNTRQCKYDKEYIIGITLFANPLCWFEPSNLSKQTMNIFSSILDTYKLHRDNIQRGDILAIGDRPNDKSYTGFISYNKEEKNAYLLLFREDNKQKTYTYNIDLLKEKKIKNIEYIINNKQGQIKLSEEKVILNIKEKSFMLVKVIWE